MWSLAGFRPTSASGFSSVWLQHPVDLLTAPAAIPAAESHADVWSCTLSQSLSFQGLRVFLHETGVPSHISGHAFSGDCRLYTTGLTASLGFSPGRGVGMSPQFV